MGVSARMRDKELRRIPPRDDEYWVTVRSRARELESDGCTGVPDFYLEACLEHDIHWRTGHTLRGGRLTTRQANLRFRLVMQDRSPLGFLSPMSWWRWVVVSIVGVVKNSHPRP